VIDLDRPVVRIVAGTVLASVPLVLFALYVGLSGSPSQQLFGVTLLTNVVIVVGMQSFIGNSGIVSFGHTAFMGVGAYAAALVTITPALKGTLLPSLPGFIADAELGYWPAIAIAALVAGAVAAPIGLVLVRLSGGAGSIATLALLIVFYVVASNWREVTGGTRTIYGIPKETTIWTALVVACVAILVARILRDSPIGLRLRASRADPMAAQAIGIEAVRLRLVAWTVSGAVVGAAGGLFALNLTAFGPTAFYLSQAFLTLAMLIIGGMSTVTGAVLGAAGVSAVYELLRKVEDGTTAGPFDFSGQVGLAQLALASLMILTMVWRREGIVGRMEIEEAARLLLRRRRPPSGPEPAPVQDPQAAAEPA